MERMEMVIGLGLTAMEVADMLKNYFEAKSLESTIERQELFRASILSAYSEAETEDFVYRPDREFRSVEDDFVGVAVIHLPTGRRRFTALSPTYLGYGLWNVVDFERGIVIHHGIGLDPSRYEFSEPHKLFPYGKIRTVQNFLIASPVRIAR